MQDIITEAIQPGADQEEAFTELIEELDPAPEAADLRDALGMDPDGSRALARGEPRPKRTSHEPQTDDTTQENGAPNGGRRT